MATDHFCLKWNNFHSCIVTAFESLRSSEDLVDVTLMCEGRNVKAHKVILSACSPYFRNLFKETPCQHPIIILKDVLHCDLVAILQFMYQGEVLITQDGLASFLKTGELLQVSGLAGNSATKAPIIPAPAAPSPTTVLPSVNSPAASPYPTVNRKEVVAKKLDKETTVKQQQAELVEKLQPTTFESEIEPMQSCSYQDTEQVIIKKETVDLDFQEMDYSSIGHENVDEPGPVDEPSIVERSLKAHQGTRKSKQQPDTNLNKRSVDDLSSLFIHHHEESINAKTAIEPQQGKIQEIPTKTSSEFVTKTDPKMSEKTRNIPVKRQLEEIVNPATKFIRRDSAKTNIEQKQSELQEIPTKTTSEYAVMTVPKISDKTQTNLVKQHLEKAKKLINSTKTTTDQNQRKLQEIPTKPTSKFAAITDPKISDKTQKNPVMQQLQEIVDPVKRLTRSFSKKTTTEQKQDKLQEITDSKISDITQKNPVLQQLQDIVDPFKGRTRYVSTKTTTGQKQDKLQEITDSKISNITQKNPVSQQLQDIAYPFKGLTRCVSTKTTTEQKQDKLQEIPTKSTSEFATQKKPVKRQFEKTVKPAKRRTRCASAKIITQQEQDKLQEISTGTTTEFATMTDSKMSEKIVKPAKKLTRSASSVKIREIPEFETKQNKEKLIKQLNKTFNTLYTATSSCKDTSESKQNPDLTKYEITKKYVSKSEIITISDSDSDDEPNGIANPEIFNKNTSKIVSKMENKTKENDVSKVGNIKLESDSNKSNEVDDKPKKQESIETYKPALRRSRRDVSVLKKLNVVVVVKMVIIILMMMMMIIMFNIFLFIYI